MAVPCCQSFFPQGVTGPRPRHPHAFKIAREDTNTYWPLASEAWMDYTREKGAANAYHFRMGPYFTDEETEVDLAEFGGPYLEPMGEFNPVFFQKTRDLGYHAFKAESYLEVVPIDTWGCKYAQQGNRYIPWSQEAIEACGRVWHPEHERYARKVVSELTCFGNVIWALDNEGKNIPYWQRAWFDKLRETIRDEEQKSACEMPDGSKVPFVHMIGTSVDEVQGSVDYSITHEVEPLLPIAGRWTINNEHNPVDTPQAEAQSFKAARTQGLTWALWRGDWSDADFEEGLRLFKAVATGTEPPPVSKCPKPLAEGAYVYMRSKPLDQPGRFDGTPWVKGDPEFCRLIHGEAVNDCHLDGWTDPAGCGMELLGQTIGRDYACPVWEWTVDNGASAHPCNDDHDDVASCDHFGHDDPETPDVYEGVPAQCGEQRNAWGPMAGFFVVAHGKAKLRACRPDYTGCGSWGFFDYSE